MMSLKDQISAMNRTLANRGSGNAKENATHLIRGAKDVQNEVIEVPDRMALYLLECEDCVYSIEGKPIKISIEKCKNVKLVVEGKVLTGVVDAWKSENLDLEFTRAVSTFELDSINAITIRMPEEEYFGQMVWSKVEETQLHLGDEEHRLNLAEVQGRNQESSRFKTTIVQGSLKTEAIYRLEDGYLATRAEEAKFKEMERKKDEVLRPAQPEDD
ncbi:hypothetical protein BGW38_003174 [Lunasporangiospora selenospora]|uniref:Adenylate cyclase-associated CAP C-terminal domain-containing protein n=1 Tax=Lunasporangiospora selenospora TaxID=979761 RepID=A0A9P6FRD2_9FUNG|nr:hypothetical protein BGW38_003174 [Lunasporangiospora selenospora]